jgi:ribosome-binding protein aMBF1 (putative translation factor)
MPALMKKPLTRITVLGSKVESFLVPEEKLKVVTQMLQKCAVKHEESVPWRQVFEKSESFKKYGEAGTIIRGGRAKEGFTQQELANKLGITQGDLSKMEHSKRPIGKKMAKKLAKVLRIDYRVFL